MFSSSPLWIGDMRKTSCVKIKPVQSGVFHLLQLDKVELRDCLKSSASLAKERASSVPLENLMLNRPYDTDLTDTAWKLGFFAYRRKNHHSRNNPL